MSSPTTISVDVSLGPKKTPLLRRLQFPITLSFAPSRPPTVRDVKRAIQKTYPALYADRQKLALPAPDTNTKSIALADESALLFDAAGKVELVVGDLGPQISWRTVFVVEYLGPLVIHPTIYYLPHVFYRTEVEHSALQKSIFAMVMLHFLKREIETLFLHRFSHATMPLFNIFKNSGHYHILAGIFLAYDLYRPGFSQSAVAGTWLDNPATLRLAVLRREYPQFAQLSNLHNHITLRRLRPAGTSTRAVPTGYGFSWPFALACPNYFFELVAWSTITLMTGSLAAGLFLGVSFVQILAWAQKKHRAYKKEFGDKYSRSRKAFIPFLL
ncbi:S5A-REDUCTASE domain-containing protein [Mycena kentingensis (nom. inval.)]|nr:S5A-REDUCTASE domain-containing protein [Mycena kentingensis (nom. inval.)]